MPPVSGHAVPVAISGGSAAQRGLLRTILQGMPATRIRALRVDGSALRVTPVAADDSGRRDPRLQWEQWLIGTAYRDRSAALGLPRVEVVGSGERAEIVQPPTGFNDTPSQPPAGAAAFRDRLIAAIDHTGLRVTAVSVWVPDGYAARLRIESRDPIGFFKRQQAQLTRILVRARGDGYLYTVATRSGQPLYQAGDSLRLSSGFASLFARRYAGCEQGRMTAIGYNPPPCPSS